MKTELWKVSDVKPYPGNPRLNDDAVEAVAASIREFGFRQPLVVDTEGVIICGHTRYKAAQHLGLQKVPVHRGGPPPPAQRTGGQLLSQLVAGSSRTVRL